ncbi:MAG TPA: VCBS repeat-containing protein [Thermoanaerobaculia bacterium]|nr:VCBS repeat-containing protein [Thermoanaerobaculia bacterium]
MTIVRNQLFSFVVVAALGIAVDVNLLAQSQNPLKIGVTVNEKAVGRPTQTACSPPFNTPRYIQPVDDGIALGTLIEGAGYGASTNSDWTDIASGNFCGGAEKELVLVKNKHSNFSIMRGPTPFAVGAFDDLSDPAQPWRAVTAGNLDGDAFDEIVAVRKVATSGAPDIFVMKVNPSACDVVTIAVSAKIGTKNSGWLDAAIGNFDGTGQQLALIERSSPAFQLARPFGGTLARTFGGNLDTNASYPWRGIAAGDLDGDGIDELIATRKVNDGKGTTVLVYKWARNTFTLVATSTFGNTGNSEWTGVTVGDFNGDAHAAIGLTKNAHSNFAILAMLPGNPTLRVLATSDLDSVAGQQWRGVTAVDWLGEDNGAAELVAVRAARNPYRADLFVYGNPFHRVRRDSGIEGNRAEYDQRRLVPPADLVANLAEAHATTLDWSLVEPPDYAKLVEFLDADVTKYACIDGRKLRVSVTLVPKVGCALPGPISQPVDSPITPWNELAFFSGSEPVAMCKDTLGWASVLGRLARDYPQIVSVGIDDFTHHPQDYPGEELAELQSRLRNQAPWLTFVPTVYYGDLGKIPPDLARTFDTWLFYFRNEKKGQCLSDPCGTNSVENAPGEIAAATAMLPTGRRIQIGTYWGLLFDATPPNEASNRYDNDLVRVVRSIPGVAGVTAYPMIVKTPNVVCDEHNFLDDEFCTLQHVFSMQMLP